MAAVAGVAESGGSRGGEKSREREIFDLGTSLIRDLQPPWGWMAGHLS